MALKKTKKDMYHMCKRPQVLLEELRQIKTVRSVPFVKSRDCYFRVAFCGVVEHFKRSAQMSEAAETGAVSEIAKKKRQQFAFMTCRIVYLSMRKAQARVLFRRARLYAKC